MKRNNKQDKAKQYRYRRYGVLVLLVLLSFSLQGCFGIGNDKSATFDTKQTTKDGTTIGINKTDQAVFSGKFYFTIDRNLYELDSQRNLKQLTQGLDVRDPALSPDGKQLIFVIRRGDYSDIATMPADGGKIDVVRSGQGSYYNVDGIVKSRANWIGQPSFSADGKSILFLSDLGKENWYQATGQDAPLLDPQVFTVPTSDPGTDTPQYVAYSDYGAGGDRDAAFRPNTPNEIIYTHYTYDPKNISNLLTQIYLADSTLIADNPYKYRPGTAKSQPDTGVALTPEDANVRNYQPIFSPTGDYIAYTHSENTSDQLSIYVQKVPKGITATPGDAADQQGIASYKSAQLIVKGQYICQPVWSPDGKSLAYITYTNGAFDLWLAHLSVDAKGNFKLNGDPIQLTDTSNKINADSRPIWAK